MKNITNIKRIIILLTVISLSSCLIEEFERDILMGESEVVEVNYEDATLIGEIIDFGEGVDQYGHCWSKNSNPTINDSISIVNENVKGKYTSSLFNLQSETVYYYRSYAKSGNKVNYGKIKVFVTKAFRLPSLNLNINEVLYEEISGSINIIDLGGYKKLNKMGVCISTSVNPTVNDSVFLINNVDATGNYDFSINDLTDEQNYYVKAFAINNKGIYYTEEVVIKTLKFRIPEIQINSITKISNTSLSINIEIIDLGGLDSIINYGICYSENINPTINDLSIELGATTINANQDIIISNLDPVTQYYIKAFAVNKKGVNYSNGITALAGQLIDEGLIAYYPFNGNVQDYSGYENHATNYGATLTTDRFGNEDSAYEFDGLTNYMQLKNTIDASEGLTFSFWIKSKGLQEGENNGTIICKYNMAYNYRCFSMHIHNNTLGYGLLGNFYAFQYNTNYTDCAWSNLMTIYDIPSQWDESKFELVNPMQLPLNEWVYCVVNFTDTHVEAWVNGILTVKKEREYSIYFNTNYEPTYIGNNLLSGQGDNNHFYGIMDELRVYDRALTQDEILVLYHEGGWNK